MGLEDLFDEALKFTSLSEDDKAFVREHRKERDGLQVIAERVPVLSFIWQMLTVEQLAARRGRLKDTARLQKDKELLSYQIQDYSRRAKEAASQLSPDLASKVEIVLGKYDDKRYSSRAFYALDSTNQSVVSAIVSKLVPEKKIEYGVAIPVEEALNLEFPTNKVSFASGAFGDLSVLEQYVSMAEHPIGLGNLLGPGTKTVDVYDCLSRLSFMVAGPVEIALQRRREKKSFGVSQQVLRRNDIASFAQEIIGLDLDLKFPPRRTEWRTSAILQMQGMRIGVACGNYDAPVEALYEENGYLEPECAGNPEFDLTLQNQASRLRLDKLDFLVTGFSRTPGYWPVLVSRYDGEARPFIPIPEQGGEYGIRVNQPMIIATGSLASRNGRSWFVEYDHDTEMLYWRSFDSIRGAGRDVQRRDNFLYSRELNKSQHL